MGQSYSVTSAAGCEVRDANGRILCTVDAGTQGAFMATTPKVEITDEEAAVIPFDSSPTAIGGGGAKIAIDTTPTQGSSNAVSSGGVYEAFESFKPTVSDVIMASPTQTVLPAEYEAKTLATNATSSSVTFGTSSINLEAKAGDNNCVLSVGDSVNGALLSCSDTEVARGFAASPDSLQVLGAPLEIVDGDEAFHACSVGQMNDAVEPLAESVAGLSQLSHSHDFKPTWSSNPRQVTVAYTVGVPTPFNAAATSQTCYEGVAIGDYIKLTKGNSFVVVGRGAKGGQSGSVSIGSNASSGNPFSTAIGYGASNNIYCTTIGSGAKGATFSSALGNDANANASGAVAIGSGAVAIGYYSTAVGAQMYENKAGASLFGAKANYADAGTFGAFVGTHCELSSDGGEPTSYFRVGELIRSITQVENEDGSVTTTTVTENKGVRISMALLMARLLELGGEEFSVETSRKTSTESPTAAGLSDSGEPVVMEETQRTREDGSIAETETLYSDGSKVIIDYNPYGADHEVMKIESHYTPDGMLAQRITTYSDGTVEEENL